MFSPIVVQYFVISMLANVLPIVVQYFVRSRIITDCKVKQNVVVDVQKKIVDEEKHSKLVDTIFDA